MLNTEQRLESLRTWASAEKDKYAEKLDAQSSPYYVGCYDVLTLILEKLNADT